MTLSVLYKYPPVQDSQVVRGTLFQSMRFMTPVEIADYLAYTSLTFGRICRALDRLVELKLAEKRVTYFGTEIYRYRW